MSICRSQWPCFGRFLNCFYLQNHFWFFVSSKISNKWFVHLRFMSFLQIDSKELCSVSPDKPMFCTPATMCKLYKKVWLLKLWYLAISNHLKLHNKLAIYIFEVEKCFWFHHLFYTGLFAYCKMCCWPN